jgi:hypothetical protein
VTDSIQINRYKVERELVIGAVIENQQADILLDPTKNLFLESDGKTIWLDVNGQRLETITHPIAISMWLELGVLKEV